jgi:hypothetical protein
MVFEERIFAGYKPDMDTFVGLFWWNPCTQKFIAYTREQIPDFSVEAFPYRDHKETWADLKEGRVKLLEYFDPQYKGSFFYKYPRGRIEYSIYVAIQPTMNVHVQKDFKNDFAMISAIEKTFNIEKYKLFPDQHPEGY